jgi:AsmA protein
MNKTLKIVLIVVGVLIVLVLVIPFLIPVNQFRPTIEEKASAALGRKVELGNLSLSLLSGSVSADNLSIGDDPKFSSAPFLTAKSLNVGVEIMPLIFSKTLNITGVTIASPQVTLLHNAAGVWNYSSLGGAAAKAEAKKAPAEKPSGAANVADISIKKLTLSDGSIIVGSTSSQSRSTYKNLTVTASDVSITSKFPVSVSADLPAGGKFKLDGTMGPVDQANSEFTPLDAKLNITALNLASTGLLDPSMGLGGIADLDANVSSKGGEAQTKGTAKLSNALLVAGGSPAGVPVTVNFDTKYNLRKNFGVLNPSTVKIGNAAANLNGTYEAAGEATVVNIKLGAKDMPAKDLQSFLPALGINLPKGASLSAGTLNADLNVTGPTNKLVIAGAVGLFNGVLAGFDLGSKMSSVASLAGIKSGKDLNIERFTSNLRVAPDGIKADNVLAVLPTIGNLAGAGTVDSKNNLDFKMLATLTKEASSMVSSVGGAGGAALGGAGGAAGALGGLLGSVTGGGGSGGSSGGMKIPFQIQGTTSDPKFIPDIGGLAKDLFKAQLGNLGGKAAPGATKTPGQNPADAINALGGLFKKKKP